MAATIIQTPTHAFSDACMSSSVNAMSLRGSPSFMDSFNDGWRNALKVHGNGGTTAAINSAFGQTSHGTNNTSGGYMNGTMTNNATNTTMMRTDVFPQFESDSVATADCSPRVGIASAYGATLASSPSSYLGYTSMTGTTGGTTQLGNTSTSMDVSDSDTAADGLDFSSFSTMLPSAAVAGVEWSTTGMSVTNTSTIELPSQSLLQMHRDDSLIGKSIGFAAFSSEIDAAPASTATVATPSSLDVFGSSMPLAFDVAPQSSSVTPANGSAANEFGSLNFDLTFPGLGDIIGAIPTTATHAIVPSSNDSVDDEPDASSVTDVDAASDAWSVSSGPSSPMHAPLSPISQMIRIAPIAPGAPTNPNASLALRPGPYTRGRAAALASPSAPRELKPVPVARGPHAGLLGGGEMATVGIYTKDDRWRKIERLREKRRARIVVKSTGGQYACRKSFADRRPRIGGRFVKMDDETKRYLSLTKPGVAAPTNLPQPAALRAYAQQSAAGVPIIGAPSQLAMAAAAASMSSPMMPLFGHSSTLLPPSPSWPAAAVNTTNGNMWFGDYSTTA